MTKSIESSKKGLGVGRERTGKYCLGGEVSVLGVVARKCDSIYLFPSSVGGLIL